MEVAEGVPEMVTVAEDVAPLSPVIVPEVGRRLLTSPVADQTMLELVGSPFHLNVRVPEYGMPTHAVAGLIVNVWNPPADTGAAHSASINNEESK